VFRFPPRALLLSVLLGCSEPPPPVAGSLLERVTVAPASVSLGPRSAEAVVARVPRGFWENTARPVFGRTFLAGDFSPGADVCILAYGLWERLGSGESDAPLVIGDRSFQVVGVMPETFRIPLGVDVWIPEP